MTYAELAANPNHRPIHDRWQSDPEDRDYLPPEQRWCILCGKLDALHPARRSDDTRKVGR